MIGFRGASRYVAPDFADCFAMECEALRYVRDTMGLSKVKIMIPFVRTLGEADGVLQLLAKRRLHRGDNDLEVIMSASCRPTQSWLTHSLIISMVSRSAPMT